MPHCAVSSRCYAVQRRPPAQRNSFNRDSEISHCSPAGLSSNSEAASAQVKVAGAGSNSLACSVMNSRECLCTFCLKQTCSTSSSSSKAMLSQLPASDEVPPQPSSCSSSPTYHTHRALPQGGIYSVLLVRCANNLWGHTTQPATHNLFIGVPRLGPTQQSCALCLTHTPRAVPAPHS